MKKYFLITILLLSIQSFSQNLNKSKIDETLINYFSSMGLKENFPSGRFIQFKEHDEIYDFFDSERAIVR